ncbi:MAG: DinB family protein [Luteitalea sp.]
MNQAQAPEVWMRGPVAGYAAELQPVVHALLQVRDEVEQHAASLTTEQLWARPAETASIGFHLRHLAGSLDRLLTYARGEPLTADQFETLRTEADPGMPAASPASVLSLSLAGIDRALDQLRATDASTLRQARLVGRARYPTTVLGLLFHAAEHASRHAGQIATTRKVVTGPHA